MAKVEKIEHNGELHGYMITSPATGQNILFDKRWTFNGDMENPTFRPSMLINYDMCENPEIGLVREHFFVTNGKIQYLADCHHNMAGKTVDMIECTWGEL